MTELRVPTLQHLARNWRPEPVFIARELVRLAKNPPRFNYNPLHLAVRDLLVLHVPYEQVLAGIQKIRRDWVRNNLIEVLPLINDHFGDVHPDFCQTIERRFYPVGRGLMVPFDPPMLYGVGGQLYFPWFSFWRSNPIAREQLSLFVTLVDEVLMQDPDLEAARFQILDFSAVGAKDARQRRLLVTNAADIPRVAPARKAEMLEVFAEGYFQAIEMLAGWKPEKDSKPTKKPEDRPPQFPGFPDL